MKLYRSLLLAVIFVFIALGFTGCASDTVTRSDFALDTVVTVTIYGTKDNSLLTEPFNVIKDYDSKLDAFSSDSEIGKINAAAGVSAVTVSHDTVEIIKDSLAYSKETDGAFDITVGPLVTMWNIGEPVVKDPPSADAVAAAQAQVDYTKVQVDETNNTVYLTEPGMALNLGAVAKGYISEKVKECLVKEGVTHAIVNLGGNVVLVGGKTGSEDFSVGVEDPADPDKSMVGNLTLKDKAVVTSGDYQRYFTDSSGKRYCHILNARTGYPADNDLHQVTVVADDPFKSDALSTSLFLMGSEKAQAYVKAHSDIMVILVTTDNRVLVSNGLKDVFSFNSSASNGAYKLSYY